MSAKNLFQSRPKRSITSLIFRQSQFDLCHELLRVQVRSLVHVPARLNQPVFEGRQSPLFVVFRGKQVDQMLANFRNGNHVCQF